MKVMANRISTITALLVGLSLGSNAHAYWSLDSSAAASGSSINGTASGEGSVQLSGYYVSNSSLSSNWTKGTLTDYSGNGIGMLSGTDSGSPTHAIDNNGNTEAVLLSFGNNVALTSIGLGFTSNGTQSNCASGCNSNTATIGVDVSLFRWVGTGAPNLASTVANLMSSWELVGNYGDLAYDTTNPYNTVNSKNLSSSYWLISAYNSGFKVTNNVTESRGTIDATDDYFKLFAVAGNVTPSPRSTVAEPASWALASLALLGVAGLRRRKAA